jgi:hypothetical protein
MTIAGQGVSGSTCPVDLFEAALSLAQSLLGSSDRALYPGGESREVSKKPKPSRKRYGRNGRGRIELRSIEKSS